MSLFTLSILIVSAIDNMKNLPATALFGSPLMFFFILSAILFLIPTALVSAHLSAVFSGKGGIYHWVEKTFGNRVAFLAVWLQWINTMVWYPTMLSFVAGTLAYVFFPELAENKTYVVTTILVIFWGLTLINLKGIHASAVVTKVCSIVGMMLPMLLLIACGFFWVLSGQEIAISLQPSEMLPSFNQSDSWVSLIAIMASFLGIELAGVHMEDVNEPRKTFPKAIMLATLFIFLSMSLSSLAIAVVLPQEDIRLTSGVMQVFHSFFATFELQGLTPFLAASIAIGSIGTMINWVISPAKGLMQAAEAGFLPPVFAKKNKDHVSPAVLIVQALVVSAFSLVFLLLPSIDSFFWFLTALSTELYMGVYLILFLVCLNCPYDEKGDTKLFQIPGGKKGIWGTCLVGLSGCLLTIIVSFFPPSGIEVGSVFQYFCLILIGNVATIAPVFAFFLYRQKKRVLA